VTAHYGVTPMAFESKSRRVSGSRRLRQEPDTQQERESVTIPVTHDAEMNQQSEGT
jgi:hypothetical protein